MENDEQTQLLLYHAATSSMLFITTLSAHRNQQLDSQFKILQLSEEIFTAFYVNIYRDTWIYVWIEMFVQMCTDIFDGRKFFFLKFRKTKRMRKFFCGSRHEVLLVTVV
ncbi:hypothetical protein ACKWTF_004710 [Chironomus riparius]